jgi:hypothetical protein
MVPKGEGMRRVTTSGTRKQVSETQIVNPDHVVGAGPFDRRDAVGDE